MELSSGSAHGSALWLVWWAHTRARARGSGSTRAWVGGSGIPLWSRFVVFEDAVARANSATPDWKVATTREMQPCQSEGYSSRGKHKGVLFWITQLRK